MSDPLFSRAGAERFDAPPFAYRALALTVFGSLALGSAVAVAQSATPSLPQVDVVDTGVDANGKLNLDTPSETGSRLGLTPRETPASVTIVNRATIDARGAQDTQEILRAGLGGRQLPGLRQRHLTTGICS